MNGNIDKVREALDYARRFSDNIGIEYRCNAALSALSAIDPEAIRREERSRSSGLVLELAHDFSSGEYYSRMKIITALHNLASVLSAEPAQDEPTLPSWFNPNDPCDSCAREVDDPACLGCENIKGQVDSEWIPKEVEPAQDDGRPGVGNDIEVVAQVIRYHISAGGEYEYRGKIAMESFERIKRRLEEAKE